MMSRGTPLAKLFEKVCVVLMGEERSVASTALRAVGSMGLQVVDVLERSVPMQCLNASRGQLEATCVALRVREIVPYDCIALGIVNHDAYVAGLNFVFGLALPHLAVATVYTPRLRLGRVELFEQRLFKEVMHELGHVLGLEHCSNRLCVMSFSNSLLEVDLKRPAFCRRCFEKLVSLGLRPSPRVLLNSF